VSVFSAAIGAGNWLLVVIGVVASVVAAFFYLRVIVLMYMQDPEREADEDRSVPVRLVLLVPAAAVLVLGILPGVIVGVIDKASVLRW
jgi:NADH-quinone oxidoreductase subunit N